MLNFIFEMLVEEIPHGVLPYISQHMKDRLPSLLKKTGASYQEIAYFITPRRLAFSLKGLPLKGQDQIIEQKGPSVKSAYDNEGNPSRALEGFLNSYQVKLNDLEEREIKGQKYLFIQKQEKGADISLILADVLQELFSSVKFTQPMRWNKNNTVYEFIRPVRNILAVLDNKLLPLEFFGLESSQYTYGHRQLFPDKILIPHADNYESILKQHGCIPSFDERQKTIQSQIVEILTPIDGIALLDQELLNTLTSLTEYPHALLAEFDKEFLTLPKEVLISEMKIHQKYVPIVDKQGAIIPYYIIVANVPYQDQATKEHILSGNNRVLRARFADGQFFFMEDMKKGLEFYANQLSSVAFVDGAGSMQDKIKRMLSIGEYLRNTLTPHIDKQTLSQSISLAKADLNSLMVGEFPELQGVIGYYYATNQGVPQEIALAIKEHYYPMNIEGDSISPSQELSALVGLADRLDNLFTLYAVGKTVTGSRDPYALRRQTIAIINILLQYQWHQFSLKDTFAHCAFLYNDIMTCELTEWKHLLSDFIKTRLEGILKSEPYTYDTDTLNAVLSEDINFILEDISRATALDKVRYENQQSFAHLIELFKRLSNILKDESIREFNKSLLQEEAEKKLYQVYQSVDEKIITLPFYEKLLELVNMEAAISEFFDSIMVKVGGELQDNRIALLSLVYQLFVKQANFNKLS